MLLGCAFCERLEPVGDMGHIVLHRPFFHAFGNPVRRLAVKRHSLVDALKKCFEGVGIEVLAHLCPVEDELSVVVGSLTCRHFHRYGLLLEGLLYQICSVNTHNTIRL